MTASTDSQPAGMNATSLGVAARSVTKVELWRLALAVLWFGLVAAISFIEAPLKFQAPGISIPLGLGIGRLVFTALNAVEGAVLLTLTVLTFWPRISRLGRGRLGVWIGLATVFLAKVLLVRPPLNARTDLVLAGAEPGQSLWHYVYIACDLATLALLLVFAVHAAQAILQRSARITS